MDRNVKTHLAAALLGVACSLIFAGCDGWKRSEETDEPSEPSHPAVKVVESYLEAVQYRDVERAWNHHVESTERGLYCSSDAFEKVLERTREEKTERDCRDVRKVGPERRASLEEDAVLLLQILRFTCEHPEGTCRDYAREVFTTQLPKSKIWEQTGEYRIRRVEADDEETNVYVDLWRGEAAEAEIHRQNVELIRHDDRWVVTTGPSGEERRRLPDEDAIR